MNNNSDDKADSVLESLQCLREKFNRLVGIIESQKTSFNGYILAKTVKQPNHIKKHPTTFQTF